MKYLLTLALLVLCALLTLVMLLTGTKLHFTYIPGISGEAIADYSPSWLLLVFTVALVFLLYRSFIGIAILFGLGVALSIDLYPLWVLTADSANPPVMQSLIIAILWLTIGCGALAMQHFRD